MTTTTKLEPLVREFVVPSWRVDSIKARIEKIAKRAKRLGQELRIEELEPTVRHDATSGLNFYETAIRLIGERPIIAGWKFIGTIDHHDCGNILRALPGESIPESFRVVPKWCSHCNKKRSRIDTYVIQHVETGEAKQIGRNCLADFLGGTDPAKLLEWYESFDSSFVPDSSDEKLEDAFREGGGGGHRVPITASINRALEYGAAAIRQFGWLSGTTAREHGGYSTAGRVIENMFHRNVKPVNALFIETEDALLAAAALKWIRAKDQSWFHNSDYRSNLYYSCIRDEVGGREFGIVISLLSAYRKETEKAAEEKARLGDRSNEWFGVVGGKGQQFELTQVSPPLELSGDFGVSYLHRFFDAAGNTAIWFSTSVVLEPGTHIVKAGVKRHDERNGIKQTVLTRVKLVSTTAEPAEPVESDSQEDFGGSPEIEDDGGHYTD